MQNDTLNASTAVTGQQTVARVIEWSITRSENDKGKLTMVLGDRSYSNEVRLVRFLKKLANRIKKKKST